MNVIKIFIKSNTYLTLLVEFKIMRKPIISRPVVRVYQYNVPKQSGKILTRYIVVRIKNILYYGTV